MTNELNPTERLILANAKSAIDRAGSLGKRGLIEALQTIQDHLTMDREARAIARIEASHG